MEKGTFLNCLNCQYGIKEEDKFCSHCGQKTQLRNWSFIALINEFIVNLFNIDSKLFQTIKDVWIPAKLTQKYFLGERGKYYHPMRLLIVSLFSFIGLALLTADFSEIEIMSEDLNAYKNKLSNKELLTNLIDSLNIQDTFLINGIEEAFEMDSIINDSTNFDIGFIKLGNLSNMDFLNKSPEEVIEEQEIKTWYEKLMVHQFTKMHKDPKGMFVYLMSNLSWATFGLILLMSLFMKLLFYRGNYYFVEHFVLLSHIASFLSLTGIFIIGFKPLFDIDIPYIINILHVIAFVFGLIAVKRYYSQKWSIAIFKYLLLCVAYLFFMSFIFVLVSIIGFLIF